MGTKLNEARREIITTEIKAIERIRASYTPKQISKFDELKALDKKVKRPAQVFAYV